ncbi:hypothetical protein [Loktanella sp. S4079]|uniref:hypothetical protein n=1 Tax=Loktanella sp. S4079 TaxID=579483 RepID=UPI0005FA905A|nr:hypothetical protein [Loktanella sp. S4079]KJZ20348.1 hypothetical protein TW80_05950 [Loktanella sp. S4079]
MKTFLLAAACAFGFGSAAAACPNFNASPSESYQATGKQLYQERSFSVVAGGENYVWDCSNVTPGTDTGAGYFTTNPDFSFQLSGMGGYQLVISMVSECDSALLINTSSAHWYYDDDDNGNLDPRIVLTRPADGRIDVWAGTYDGEYCNARLSLETFDR